MKIITWNVNGIRAALGKGLLEFWKEQQPDILCLQETKAHPDQLPESLTEPEGWKGFWSAAQRPGYSGVVTFTREAPQHVAYGIDIPKFDAEGRIVLTQFKKFSLYNVYFPNGGSGEERHLYKQEFLSRFTHHLHKRVQAGENVVVVGDYNVAYMDSDVYDPKKLSQESGFLPEEREWMRGFLKEDFIDTYRYFHADKKDTYTWWSMLERGRLSNRGWRIDHICASKGLEKKLKAAQILDEQEGSDHCPVMLEFNP